MAHEMVFPEKRTAILYVKISAANKKFVRRFSKNKGVSESALLEHLLENAKDSSADLKAPAMEDEKRQEVLYCRISPAMKEFVQNCSDTSGVNSSKFMNHLISSYRKRLKP